MYWPYSSGPKWPTGATCIPSLAAAIKKLVLPPTSHAVREGGAAVRSANNLRRLLSSVDGSSETETNMSRHRLPSAITSKQHCLGGSAGGAAAAVCKQAFAWSLLFALRQSGLGLEGSKPDLRFRHVSENCLYGLVTSRGKGFSCVGVYIRCALCSMP